MSCFRVDAKKKMCSHAVAKKKKINTNEGCFVLFKCLTRNDCCFFIHQFLVFFSPDILFPVKSLKISIRGKCGQIFFPPNDDNGEVFFFSLLVSFNFFFVDSSIDEYRSDIKTDDDSFYV